MDSSTQAETVKETWFSKFFEIVPATVPEGGGLFSFSEFLATLALLLVVITVSDYKYRFRLSLTKFPLKLIAFWVGLGAGLSILLVDFWFHNGFPIPAGMNNPINIKLLIGLVFVLFVFYLNFISFVRPPRYSKGNCDRFARSLFSVVAEGDPNRMLVAAEELGPSIVPIVDAANEVRRGDDNADIPKLNGYAHDILYLLAERRFCRVLARSAPLVGHDLFYHLKDKPRAAAAASAFSSNFVSALLEEKDSTIYHEDSLYQSGLIGELKPLSTAIFGSWKLVEQCTTSLNGPLHLRFSSVREMDGEMAESFVRCATIFCDDYFKQTGGRVESDAMRNLLESLEHFTSDLYQLNGLENSYKRSEHVKLDAVVQFIRDFIGLLDKYDVQQGVLRKTKYHSNCPYDRIANLIMKVIHSSTGVKESEWNAWSIHHNAIWSPIFSYSDTEAMAVIRRKVTRLIYNEIVEEPHPTFVGANLIGYVLSVLGWRLDMPNYRSRKKFYPLRKVVVNWVVNNYYTFRLEAPKVAEACLLGKVTFDEENNRFVKTYPSWKGGEDSEYFLPIKVPDSDTEAKAADEKPSS